jgi:hypothetical protein
MSPGATRVFRDDALQRRFETHGFVTLTLMSPDEAARACASVLAAYRARDVAADAGSPKQDYHVSALHPDAAYRSTAFDLARTIVGDRIAPLLHDYRYLVGSFLIKEPGAPPLGVHRDWPVTADPEETVLNCWCPLVDVDAERGAVGLVDGSWRVLTGNIGGPGIPWCFQSYCEEFQQPEQAVALRAGQAVVFDFHTLHWSAGNPTGEIRVAVNSVLVPNRSRPAVHVAGDGSAIDVAEADGDAWRDLLFTACTAGRASLPVTRSVENGNRSIGFDEFRRRLDGAAEPDIPR